MPEPVVPLVEPVEPVIPEFGLLEGVVLDVLLLVPGVVVLAEPVPEAPIDDVVPEGLVVSVLLEVLPVVVLGVVLPLRLPEPVVEPVVVDGVVDDELLEPVPLAPVVLVSLLRWQALSERAAAIARATAVSLVFIRNSWDKVVFEMCEGQP